MQDRDTVNRVYVTLRDKLLQGEISPGKRVSQRKLAQELGCSTIPVSEAMRRMESEGLLVKERSRMARVRTLSANDLKGIYLVREGLEGAAVRLCVEAITDAEIVQLQQLGREYCEAMLDRDVERMGRLDMSIHRFIVHCARSTLLEEEISRLLLIEQTAGRKDTVDWLHPPLSHQGIIQAIADRDSELAEYLLRKHIQIGYQQHLRFESNHDRQIHTPHGRRR